MYNASVVPEGIFVVLRKKKLKESNHVRIFPSSLYEGGELRMAQFFRGNLAGLMIRSGKLENKKVIDCLYTCKEGLDLQMADGVGKGVKVKLHVNKGECVCCCADNSYKFCWQSW